MHAVTYSQCRFEECLWFRQSCMQFASTTSVIRKESFVTQWRQMAITCIKKTNLPCGSANGHNDSQISKFIVAIIGCQKTNFPCCTTSQKALCCVQIGSFTFSIYGTTQDVNLRHVNKYNLHKIWKHLATSCFAGSLQDWTLNRPFYSCVLSCLAMNASEAGGDLALIQTSLLFSCKFQLVSIRTTWFAQ